MFTGIVEATALVLQIIREDNNMRIEIENPFAGVELGDSIAIDGVCLTVIQRTLQSLWFDVSSETLDKTYFKLLSVQQKVNLEQAARSDTKMGGHYVTGHIDTTAVISCFEQSDNYVKLRVSGFTSEHKRFLIPKGSITLNGVSLTINVVVDEMIELMLIPHTLKHTTLQNLKIGQLLNVEFDYMARMIAHQVAYYLQHVTP